MPEKFVGIARVSDRCEGTLLLMELRPTARSLQIVSSSAYSIKSLRTWKDKHAGAVDDIDQAVQQLERLQLSSQFVAGLEQDAANSSVISQRLRLALKESLGRCGTVLQDLDAQLSGAKDKHGSINLQKGRYVCSVDSLLEHLNNLKKETRRLDLLLDAYQR